jgi:hypothetical protein
MAIKYINIFESKALQNLPKLGFWFENKQSGNPGRLQSRKEGGNARQRLSFITSFVDSERQDDDTDGKVERGWPSKEKMTFGLNAI